MGKLISGPLENDNTISYKRFSVSNRSSDIEPRKYSVCIQRNCFSIVLFCSLSIFVILILLIISNSDYKLFDEQVFDHNVSLKLPNKKPHGPVYQRFDYKNCSLDLCP